MRSDPAKQPDRAPSSSNSTRLKIIVSNCMLIINKSLIQREWKLARRISCTVLKSELLFPIRCSVLRPQEEDDGDMINTSAAGRQVKGTGSACESPVSDPLLLALSSFSHILQSTRTSTEIMNTTWRSVLCQHGWVYPTTSGNWMKFNTDGTGEVRA